MALKVSSLISDHMVLQRDKPWIIPGEAEPGAAITAVFGGTYSATVADQDGKWEVDLGEFEANSDPQVLSITATNGSEIEKLIVNDIVIGDVWLLAGQSNMQLWLSRTAHNYPEVMDQSDPLLRQVNIPQIAKLDSPRSPLELAEAEWHPFSPESAPDFSAVGYFFWEKLRERYDVPIGLVAVAVGGTPIATWLGKAELTNLGVDASETEKFVLGAAMEQQQGEEQAATEAYDKALDAADEGLTENWANPAFDDADWNSAELTDYAAGSGSHWYRKTLPVPAKMAGREAQIYLGTAIDKDTVFVNGKEIGTTYYRYPPRNYSFTMPSGSITIAIRLLAFNGGGEFAPGKNRFIATDKGTISLDGPWKTKVGTKVDNAPAQTNFNNLPTALYNGMIAPLQGTHLKGIAWYQGESDTGNPDDYGAKLTTLIQSWRSLFDDAELPFLIQQLAHWEYTGLEAGNPNAVEAKAQHHRNWETLRNQQKVALELPNVGLAAGYDVGEWNDLHPQGKRVVGERLARLAYRIAYGESLPPNMFEQYSLT